MFESRKDTTPTTDWSAIVRDHGQLVYRIAFRLLNQDADAADCCQRTFLSAIELHSREPIRNWTAVLVQLATSRALEELRARYRRSRRNEPLSDEPNLISDPSEPLASAELSERLRIALSEMDQRQATVFCLVCIDELTNVDAAEVLGITPGYVGVLLQRARKSLRHRLEMFDPAREKRP